MDSRCNLRTVSDDALYYNNMFHLDVSSKNGSIPLMSTTYCQRYISKFIDFTSFPEGLNRFLNEFTKTLNIHFIFTVSTTIDTRIVDVFHHPTLIAAVTILFISVGFTVIIVRKRHSKGLEQQISQVLKTVVSSFGAPLLEPMTQNRTKVLLVYEIEDEGIRQKAKVLHQQLLLEGVAQVILLLSIKFNSVYYC